MTPISTSNPLFQVCIKSKNPRFCLQVFGLNPHRSAYELTQEAINLALSNASETMKKIHTFLNQTKDGNLKDIYDACLDYYQSSADALRLSEEYHYLKEGQYNNVNAVGNFIQEAAFYCESEFQIIPGYIYVSTLTKDNESLDIFVKKNGEDDEDNGDSSQRDETKMIQSALSFEGIIGPQ
ncbi:hypothetical protein HAX54_001521 [Datura stramonium]|uniref:Pectinesterase inhibitor domain-containing protein n=1 Tax=Datura stramonium TaxID=4076 RepID=A0ABS8RVX1_DATST|nr:hypothetical protein [Datura stramonium]